MAYSAEQLFISAVIRSGDVAGAVRAGITEKMFYLFPGEWEWIARHYARHHRAPEKESFRSQFPDFAIVKVEDVDSLAPRLLETYAETALLGLLDTVADEMAAGGHNAMELLRKTEKEIRKISVTASSESSVDILEDWETTLAEVAGRSDRSSLTGMPGITTGFPTLDRLTGGIQPGHLWIGGARLGQGKTWWLVQIATAAARGGATVHIESLEQPRSQITARLHAFLSRGQFTHKNLSRGNVNLSEYREWLEGLQDSCSGTLQVTDATRGHATVSTVVSHIERHRPDVVIVDYLTLLRTSGGENDWKAMSTLSSDLKSAAMNYGVGIVAAAQLNREFGLRGLPGPEALAQSDAFGQDADCVVTMRRHRESDQVMEMRLSKYRHGEDGSVWSAKFAPDTGVFAEITESEVQQIIQNTPK